MGLDNICEGSPAPALSFSTNGMDNKGLRQKASAYERLFGVAPEIFVYGAWYKTIDGRHQPDDQFFSLADNPATVVWIGSGWVRLKMGDRLVDVRLHEDGGGGAKLVILAAKNG